MLPNHLILCHPFSFWLQSCPASESFPSESALPTRWPKYWNFSFSNSPINIQRWFLLRLTDLISLLSKGLSRVFSRTTIRKHHWWIKCKIQIKTETFLLLYSDPIHSFYFPPQISPLPLKQSSETVLFIVKLQDVPGVRSRNMSQNDPLPDIFLLQDLAKSLFFTEKSYSDSLFTKSLIEPNQECDLGDSKVW